MTRTLSFIAAAFLAYGASGARVCGNGTAPAAGFSYQLTDVRYDGPDPSKNLGVSTIAVGLGNGATPTYECVAQWPESWAGWYEGGSNIIWSDCIWTGAGFGQDKTVSFALDWKTKKMYLAQSYDCSDKQGSEGSASGSLALDFECSSRDGASYCLPKSTTNGTRPALRITTSPVPVSAASTCSSKAWRVENWLRRYEMSPGSSTPGAPLVSDTGPSFTLRSLPANTTFSCTTSKQLNSTFEGACKSDGATASASSVDFSFDSKINILKFSERSDCGGSPVTTVGVAYFQSICDRGFNSVVFTCTSEPLWVGAGVL
ncbi:hypothetical protein B0T16DRAFT_326382 [Cercophora newfieldiana]|uniref:AA1-like domain-containing protein n=1 Tax=Cercophora newfieldiana TaxID=92897 RepID=A0AA39YC56_9PEZI|nr:hypothetical protein B0T16DRAFT_326382 [Cercophora newfieldiana]